MLYVGAIRQNQNQDFELQEIQDLRRRKVGSLEYAPHKLPEIWGGLLSWWQGRVQSTCEKVVRTNESVKTHCVDIHNIFGMPVHDGILKIEPLQVCDGSRFDFFWESKVPT